jgi:predicted RNA-binding protein YlqC (UPF0109 family)
VDEEGSLLSQSIHYHASIKENLLSGVSQRSYSEAEALMEPQKYQDGPTTDSLKDLIEYIVRAMVDNPEQVQVSAIEGQQSTVFELRVAKPDMGKVIGIKGRNINAVRIILRCASAASGKRTMLELVEET